MTDQGIKHLKDNLWHSADLLRASARLAAKNLYKKLTEEKANVMVVNSYKDDQPKQRVMLIITNTLNEDLPESYN